MKIALNTETMETSIIMGAEELETFIAEIGVLLESRYHGDGERSSRESPTIGKFGYLGAINAAKALYASGGGPDFEERP